MKKGSTNLTISIIIVLIFVGLVIFTLVKPRPQNTTNLQNTVKVIVDNKPASNKNINTKTENLNKNMEQNKEIAKNGDTLIMNYTGRLTDGTIFDSNVDPKFKHVQPFEFVLGAGQVIKGWDEGLAGMKVGEKKTLTISPDKAYGDRTIGSIPANSTLIFDVELVGIK